MSGRLPAVALLWWINTGKADASGNALLVVAARNLIRIGTALAFLQIAGFKCQHTCITRVARVH